VHVIRGYDDPRRRTLVRLLSAAALAALPGAQALAQVFGSRPAQLPAGRSIHRLSGDVRVNGAPATAATRIGDTDTVQTGRGAEVVFAVGPAAFILRESGTLALERLREGNALVNALRLTTGKLLAVFGRGNPRRMVTTTATVGIRGTGMYAEADPEQTYFCTCYGVTDIAANADPNAKKTVAARHHDEPVYILAKAADGRSIRPAPFINHTDQELALVEALVGRKPPFVFPSGDYGGPRKDY
jgi:hypothetical protein